VYGDVEDDGSNEDTFQDTAARRYYIHILTRHVCRIQLFRSLISLKHYHKRRSAARHLLSLCLVVSCWSVGLVTKENTR